MSTCPIDGPFDRWTAQFFLEIRQDSCEKNCLPAAPNSAAEHIANFQTSPRGYRTGFDKLAVWIPILIAQEFAQGNLDADIQSNPNDKTGDQVFSGRNVVRERPNRGPVLGEEFKQGSDEIENIIRTIDNIAFQTNIRVLNTAVEATVNRITLCFCPAGDCVLAGLPCQLVQLLQFLPQSASSCFRRNFSPLHCPCPRRGCSVLHVDWG